MQPISFKRHRFPPSVILHAVWLYARFTLSFRDVEEMLSERGVDASNETIRQWFLKFGRLGMRCAGLIAGTTAIASVLSSYRVNAPSTHDST